MGIITTSPTRGPVGPKYTVTQGLFANLPVLTFGQQYFATDTNVLYIGTAGGNAPTTALPLFGLEANIPADLPVGILYYATDTNTLFVSTGPGSTMVVPVMASGLEANIPALRPTVFYLASDTRKLFVGTDTGNLLVGPGAVQSPLDLGTF